jgi:hypothetical protein
MATVKYAVLVPMPAAAPDQAGGYSVEHIYQHRADADRCAQAYQNALCMPAVATEMTPALAISRSGDAWAVLEAATLVEPRLRLFKSRAAAQAAAEAAGARPLGTPIRRAMPVQHGVPQFGPYIPSMGFGAGGAVQGL